MPITPRRRIVTLPEPLVVPEEDLSPAVAEEASPRRRIEWRRALLPVAISLVLIAAVFAGYTYRASVSDLVAMGQDGASSVARRIASYRLASTSPRTAPVEVAPGVPAQTVPSPAAVPQSEETACQEADMRADQIVRLAVAGVISPAYASADSLPFRATVPCSIRLDSLTVFLVDQVVVAELFMPGQDGVMIERTDAELRALARRRPR